MPEGQSPPQDDQVIEASSSSFPHLLAEATTLAWNLVFPIVGGVLLGRYLDDRLGQDYTWTLSLLALGVLVAFSNLYTLYIEHGLGDQTQEDKEGSDG